MGNCSSEHHSKLLQTSNFSNDPTAFRVFVKKKNKFIPGWLKINDDEIFFTRNNSISNNANNYQFWPLAYLRRYGYTCSGIFFFESGRRCATGEGLHTFQSHQAKQIFHMVQSKIKVEEYARSSRASSVISNNRTNLINLTNDLNRIHPVQRFSSEGNNSNFQTLSNTSNNIGSCQSKMHVNNLKMRSTDKAPPPYDIYYQRQLQNTLNQRSINEFNNRSNNPTQIMSASMTCASSNSRNINGMYQRQLYPLTSSAYSTNTICSNNTPKQQQQYLKHEKFQNVVSGIEQNSLNIVPNKNSSSSIVNQKTLLNESENNNILPSASLMSESYNSNNFLIDNTLNSSFNGNTSLISGLSSGSLWMSQQQLESEIISEHVLNQNNRKYLQQQLLQEQQQQQIHNQMQKNNQLINKNYKIPSSSTVLMPNLSNVNDKFRRKYHSYVNVDFTSNELSNNTLSGSVKEIRKLNRQDFLSSQPSGFVFNNNLNANINGIHSIPRTSSNNFSSVATTITTTIPNLHTPSNFNEIEIRDQMFQQQNKSKSNFYPNSNFHSYSLINDYNNNNEKLKRSNSVITQNLKSTNLLETSNLSPFFLENKKLTLNNCKKNELSDSLTSDILQMKQNYVTLNINGIKTPSFYDENNKNNVKNKKLQNNETMKLVNENESKTNYALIDYDKTKTLENIKQKQRDEIFNNKNLLNNNIINRNKSNV